MEEAPAAGLGCIQNRKVRNEIIAHNKSAKPSIEGRIEDAIVTLSVSDSYIKAMTGADALFGPQVTFLPYTVSVLAV